MNLNEFKNKVIYLKFIWGFNQTLSKYKNIGSTSITTN